MNLGIAKGGSKLLIAVHNGPDNPPAFHELEVTIKPSDEDCADGYFWDSASDPVKDLYQRADKIAFSIPAQFCYLKRLEIDDRSKDIIPGYERWRAGIQLPGDLSAYIYGFIPMRERFDHSKTESVFFAVPARQIRPLLRGLFKDDDSSRTIILPEFIGLWKVLERSIGKDDIVQAGLIHCDAEGAAVVFIKDGRLFHSRYFKRDIMSPDDFSIEIETYLLSLSDPDESIPLVITGVAEYFKTDWTPIVPAFMSIHELDFVSAWGLAEFIAAGGKCELSVAT